MFDATDDGVVVKSIPNPDDPLAGPPLEVRAVATLLDLPLTFTPEAAIFGTIAHRGTPPFAGVTVDDRMALMRPLVVALWRTTYHKGRFEQYVDVAYARFERFEGRIFGDSVALCILFETQSLLAAARAFVEEVIYVGGRRAGESPRDADRRVARELEVGGATLPEAHVLARRRDWFDELTAYRNALVHRGTLEQFGYVPVAADVPHANDPIFNVMLVPDRNSIQRPNRPDSWTFSEHRRLEILVRGLWSELLGFAREIGACWGCAIPPGATPPAELLHPSTLIVLPRGAVATPRTR